jgi:hypothetical protein
VTGIQPGTTGLSPFGDAAMGMPSTALQNSGIGLARDLLVARLPRG